VAGIRHEHRFALLAIAGNAKTIVTPNVRDVRRGDLRLAHLRLCKPTEFVELSRALIGE
jgi:hypothetical protein